MSDTYEFEAVVCINETEKAIQVEAPDLDPLSCVRGATDRCWIPKSAIHEDSEVFSIQAGERFGRLILHGWFVEKNKSAVPLPQPDWLSKAPPRGQEVPTPEVLLNRPLKPPGRK